MTLNFLSPDDDANRYITVVWLADRHTPFIKDSPMVITEDALGQDYWDGILRTKSSLAQAIS